MALVRYRCPHCECITKLEEGRFEGFCMNCGNRIAVRPGDAITDKISFSEENGFIESVAKEFLGLVVTPNVGSKDIDRFFKTKKNEEFQQVMRHSYQQFANDLFVRLDREVQLTPGVSIDKWDSLVTAVNVTIPKMAACYLINGSFGGRLFYVILHTYDISRQAWAPSFFGSGGLRSVDRKIIVNVQKNISKLYEWAMYKQVVY